LAIERSSGIFGERQAPHLRHPLLRVTTDWRRNWAAPIFDKRHWVWPILRLTIVGLRGCSMAAKVTTGTTAPEGVGPKKVFPPLDRETFAPQLIWLALTFGLLYMLMKRFALPKVAAAIEERRQQIEQDLKTAEKIKAETQLALSRYELALTEARQKASAIAKDARDKLVAEADANGSKHDALIAQKLAEAEQRIAQSKARAVASLHEIAPDIVGAIVARLIGIEVGKDELQRMLMQRAAE
jgi:F-type H+-transporting ATPase subunit b